MRWFFIRWTSFRKSYIWRLFTCDILFLCDTLWKVVTNASNRRGRKEYERGRGVTFCSFVNVKCHTYKNIKCKSLQNVCTFDAFVTLTKCSTKQFVQSKIYRTIFAFFLISRHVHFTKSKVTAIFWFYGLPNNLSSNKQVAY